MHSDQKATRSLRAGRFMTRFSNISSWPATCTWSGRRCPIIGSPLSPEKFSSGQQFTGKNSPRPTNFYR